MEDSELESHWSHLAASGVREGEGTETGRSSCFAHSVKPRRLIQLIWTCSAVALAILWLDVIPPSFSLASTLDGVRFHLDWNTSHNGHASWMAKIWHFKRLLPPTRSWRRRRSRIIMLMCFLWQVHEDEKKTDLISCSFGHKVRTPEWNQRQHIPSGRTADLFL